MRFDDYISDTRALVDKILRRPPFFPYNTARTPEGALIAIAAAANNPKVGGLDNSSRAGTQHGRPAQGTAGRPCASADGLRNPDNRLAESRKGIPRSTGGTQFPFPPSVQPFLISCMRYEPAELIKQVKCPILVIQGNMDIQVSLQDAEILCQGQPGGEKSRNRGDEPRTQGYRHKDLQTQLFKTYMNPFGPFERRVCQGGNGFRRRLTGQKAGMPVTEYPLPLSFISTKRKWQRKRVAAYAKRCFLLFAATIRPLASDTPGIK